MDYEIALLTTSKDGYSSDGIIVPNSGIYIRDQFVAMTPESWMRTKPVNLTLLKHDTNLLFAVNTMVLAWRLGESFQFMTELQEVCPDVVVLHDIPCNYIYIYDKLNNAYFVISGQSS